MSAPTTRTPTPPGESAPGTVATIRGLNLPGAHLCSAFSGIHAALYDYMSRQNQDDIAWYRSNTPPGSRVLDLGCGAGRVARGLAAGGATVTAVDSSPAMITRAASASSAFPSIRYLEGDITALDLGRVHDVVVVAGLTLSLFPDAAARARVFDVAGRHVAPGGLLLLDYIAAGDGDSHDVYCVPLTPLGVTGFTLIDAHRDDDAGIQVAELYTEVVRPDASGPARLFATTTSRLLPLAALEDELGQHGFEVIAARPELADGAGGEARLVARYGGRTG